MVVPDGDAAGKASESGAVAVAGAWTLSVAVLGATLLTPECEVAMPKTIDATPITAATPAIRAATVMIIR